MPFSRDSGRQVSNVTNVAENFTESVTEKTGAKAVKSEPFVEHAIYFEVGIKHQ